MNEQTKKRDGNEIAAEYDVKICLSLTTFGYLTSRMIAGLIRPQDDAGLRSAQRRLTSLTKRGIVIQELLDNGIPVYKLSKKGADFLLDLGYEGIPERGTRDARIGNPVHRALSNNFLIFQLLPDIRYWPEYLILRGRSPLSFFDFEQTKMVPDALIDTADGLFWIEAENSVKKPERLARLARLADHLFSDFNGHMFNYKGELFALRGMIFICPNEPRVRAVARAFADIPADSLLKERVSIVYAPMPRSLIWPDAVETESAYQAAVNLGYARPEPGSTSALVDASDNDSETETDAGTDLGSSEFGSAQLDLLEN